jgi:ankyrin repeat protein
MIHFLLSLLIIIIIPLTTQSTNNLPLTPFYPIQTSYGVTLNIPSQPQSSLLAITTENTIITKDSTALNLITKSPEKLLQLVTSTFDAIIISHPEGLSDPKTPSNNNNNALTPEEASYHFAAAHAAIIDSARFLITFGIAPSLQIGGPPIHTAVHTNNIKLLQELLLSSSTSSTTDASTFVIAADEPKSFDLSTPLHAASSLNRLQAAQLLLQSGANVEARPSHGATPLMIAASLNHHEMIELLHTQGHANLDATHPYANTTALHFAAERGNIESIRILCHLGANPNFANKIGGTPLHTASDSNQPNAVRTLLLECPEVNINALLNGDTTPLYLAAQRGHDQVVHILIDHGANINHIMTQGPPKPISSSRKMTSSNPDATDPYNSSKKNLEPANGATPLHVAAENGHLKSAYLLTKHGNALHLDSMQGATPLVIAMQYHHPDIALMLLKESKPQQHICATINSKVHGDGAFALFVAAGLNEDTSSQDGGGLLLVHTILTTCKDNILIDQTNTLGASALSHAVVRKNHQIVNYLLQKTSPTITEFILFSALEYNVPTKTILLPLITSPHWDNSIDITSLIVKAGGSCLDEDGVHVIDMLFKRLGNHHIARTSSLALESIGLVIWNQEQQDSAVDHHHHHHCPSRARIIDLFIQHTDMGSSICEYVISTMLIFANQPITLSSKKFNVLLETIESATKRMPNIINMCTKTKLGGLDVLMAATLFGGSYNRTTSSTTSTTAKPPNKNEIILAQTIGEEQSIKLLTTLFIGAKNASYQVETSTWTRQGSNSGYSALMIAIERGQHKIVKTLLDEMSPEAIRLSIDSSMTKIRSSKTQESAWDIAERRYDEIILGELRKALKKVDEFFNDEL